MENPPNGVVLEGISDMTPNKLQEIRDFIAMWEVEPNLHLREITGIQYMKLMLDKLMLDESLKADSGGATHPVE